MLKSLTKSEVEAAIDLAANAPSTPRPIYGGCARIYVAVYGVDAKTINLLAKTCKKVGIMFLRKAYPSYRNVIYLGYEMGRTGAMYCKGEAFAEGLTKAGIPATVEAEGD